MNVTCDLTQVHAEKVLFLLLHMKGENSVWKINENRWEQKKLLSQTDLKSSWAPVYKLNGPLSLDGSNGSVDILGYNITSIQ